MECMLSAVFFLFSWRQLPFVRVARVMTSKDRPTRKDSILIFSLLASNIFKIHNTFSLMKFYFTENQISKYRKELSHSPHYHPPTCPCLCSSALNDWSCSKHTFIYATGFFLGKNCEEVLAVFYKIIFGKVNRKT